MHIQEYDFSSFTHTSFIITEHLSAKYFFLTDIQHKDKCPFKATLLCPMNLYHYPHHQSKYIKLSTKTLIALNLTIFPQFRD